MATSGFPLICIHGNISGRLVLCETYKGMSKKPISYVAM